MIVRLSRPGALWPNLAVYELRSRGGGLDVGGARAVPEDFGSSNAPRSGTCSSRTTRDRTSEKLLDQIRVRGRHRPKLTDEQVPLRLIPDRRARRLRASRRHLRRCLEMWAVSYEVDKNPSGALALREAVDALRDVG